MSRKQRKVLVRIVVSAVFLVGIMVFEHYVKIEYAFLRTAAYLVPYLIIGYDILLNAVRGIINRQVFDENFLMAVASLGAIALAVYENGSYGEAVFVVLFYQIGELFQSIAVGKSRRNIAGLMDIRPDYANIEQDGEIVRVEPDIVAVGSIIIASAGERIPLDGVVVEGCSSLDTSALTGESVPRTVNVGDSVVSGSINLNGTIRIRTEKVFGESTVSKILDLVENSASKKSKSEQFITKFARYYTPCVCICAIVLAVCVPLASMVFGAEPLWSDWIYRALTFLVISCPCALVISVPLGFFAGIGGATKAGVLIKGSNYIETLSKANTVIFDKTGTLTKGVFEVKKISPENGLDEASLLEYCALAEYHSSHPIAKSIIAEYGASPDLDRIKSVEEIGGCGIKAVIDDKTVAVGNKKLMESLGVQHEEVIADSTIVYTAINNNYVGYILIGDVIKESSRQAISLLKKNGIEKTVMLTGDNSKTALAVGTELGVDEIYYELLPYEKVEMAENIISKVQKGKKVVFVGDGINDAPVLTRADVGIAMGSLGSDCAVEAADVVIMDDDPMKISKAIRICRKCMKIVYENIYFALGIKALCLVLGAFGIANMWLAVFADVGVMVIAVLNSIRTLNSKKI